MRISAQIAKTFTEFGNLPAAVRQHTSHRTSLRVFLYSNGQQLHWCTTYDHPEGNSYIERCHRGLKEEEVGLAEYQNLEEARGSFARYLKEYNHDRPHRGLRDRTPREAYVSFESDLKNQAPTVQF